MCGTPSCPLWDTEDMDASARAWIKSECYCQSQEYRELTSRSPEFLHAYQLSAALDAGFPYGRGHDPELDVHMVTVLREAMERAKSKVLKEKQPKGKPNADPESDFSE